MDIGQVIHFLAGPVIGGGIGYFTNFIAIKMLFHPRTEVKIGNFTLPFTPGIIPRRKDRLARAIGESVAARVFTETDIKEIFLSDGMKDAVSDSFLEILFGRDGTRSAAELLSGFLSEEEFEVFQNRLDEAMYRKVHMVINRTDIASMVSAECAKVLKEKAQGTLLSKVLNQSRISAVSDYMGTHMQKYAKENVETMLMPILREETAHMFVSPTEELLSEIQISREQVRQMLGDIYEKFMSEYSMRVVRLFDIASLTEKKIIEFRAEEIEELVNQTIKREMQAVVNLGGVLGVVIGFVNNFF